jgi:hypothetical protein
MMVPQERDGMRALVREVIREALADARKGAGSGNAAPAIAVEPVRIASDADLAVLVRRIADLMRDPATAARIEAGTLRFRLAGPPQAADAVPAGVLQSGLVNERAIDALPEGATLRLAMTAVVTPLARDRARQRRISLERAR